MRGFTLIELILVVAVLGVVAVTALPCVFDMSLTTAKSNAMTATVSGVQEGISLLAANNATAGTANYPASLDSASAGVASGQNPLFASVLQTPITNRWIKVSGGCYAYDFNGNGLLDAGDTYFKYTSANGTFAQVTTCS